MAGAASWFVDTPGRRCECRGGFIGRCRCDRGSWPADCAGALASGLGAVMGAEAGQPPLAVAAWCDPQARTYRLSWAEVLIGLLIAGDDRIVFVTRTGW